MYESRDLISGSEYEAKQAAYANSVAGRPKTMRETLDRQITQAEIRVTRLKDLKARLDSGTSLLDLDMDDLRQGMNY